MHRCLGFLSQNDSKQSSTIKCFEIIRHEIRHQNWENKPIQYYNNILITISIWKSDMECFKTPRISALFIPKIETPGGVFVRTSGSRRSDCTPVRSRWLKSMMNAEVSRMALCPIQCYSDAQYLLWKIQTHSLFLTRTC